MNAQLIVDVNKKGAQSLFKKVGSSTFAINEAVKVVKTDELTEAAEKKEYKVANVTAVQKGSIVEARVAELITLYGDNLSCYRPISDDEGIDLIVKEKGSLKSIYIQVKAISAMMQADPFVATVKEHNVVDNYSMGFVFCLFDTAKAMSTTLSGLCQPQTLPGWLTRIRMACLVCIRQAKESSNK